MNFSLKRSVVISEVCREIFNQGDGYGSSDLGRGRTVVLEYSSPKNKKRTGEPGILIFVVRSAHFFVSNFRGQHIRDGSTSCR